MNSAATAVERLLGVCRGIQGAGYGRRRRAGVQRVQDVVARATHFLWR